MSGFEDYLLNSQAEEARRQAEAQAAYTARNFMSRDDFLKKYGKTFVADDKGGNAASEVAGQDVGGYYDRYLAPDAKGDLRTTRGAGDNLEMGIADYTMPTFGWKYRDANPYFDAWDNVKPHPESQDLGGVGEFWRQIGRPIAAGAGMYLGVNALGGLLGGSGAASAASAGLPGATPFTASQFAMPGAMNSAAALGGADLAALTAGGGAAGGAAGVGLLAPGAAGLTLPSVTVTGAAGGAAGGVGAGTLGAAGAGVSGLAGLAGNESAAETARLLRSGTADGGSFLDKAGNFLTDPSNLLKLGGAALGALSAKDSTQSSSQSRDPWGPAQAYLKDNLATNAAAQEYYRQNPFTNEQKTAYQGLLNTNANNQLAGNGLLANANNFMQSRRGVMPTMQAMPTNTQAAPIDWSQYQNIGRR